VTADERAVLIVNPLRGRGALKHLARMQQALEALGLSHDVWFTERRGHGTELARRAISQGYLIIVAVGGDGTVNEVVNGIAGSDATLGALPLGANNDYLRSLGIWTWQQACSVVAQGVERALDVGLAEYHDLEEGGNRQRYYAVLADVGLGSEVVRNTPRHFRHALGGGLGYVISLYRTALQGRARAREMRLEVDGVLRYQSELLLVEVLNGSYAGGGLKVAPRARLDDGLLDVFVAEDIHWLRIWTLFPEIYRGTHVDHEKTSYFQARTVGVETEIETIVSIDGEVVGRAPARFTVMPGLLKARCPRPRGEVG
jgi:diacylglycerol kinase (ATP)